MIGRKFGGAAMVAERKRLTLFDAVCYVTLGVLVHCHATPSTSPRERPPTFRS